MRTQGPCIVVCIQVGHAPYIMRTCQCPCNPILFLIVFIDFNYYLFSLMNLLNFIDEVFDQRVTFIFCHWNR